MLVGACGDKAVKRGILYDSEISNLNYRTDSFSGLTNEIGEFQYRPHEIVTFSLGAIQFGQYKGNSVITLLQISDSALVTDNVVTNKARLLQSLDADLNSNNGIQIPLEAHSAAISNIDFTLSVQAFEVDDRVRSLMQAVKGDDNLLVSAEVAQAHVQNTLDKLGFNQAPKVTVSDDQTVTSGDQVSINATVTDVDGTIVDVNWRQVLEDDDVKVTLTPAVDEETNEFSGLSMTFIAPTVESITIFTFVLKATDDQGAETNLTTRVTINPSD